VWLGWGRFGARSEFALTETGYDEGSRLATGPIRGTNKKSCFKARESS